MQLCDTNIEYIPEVTEDSHDYNMSTENNILDSKIHAPETINDPTYPGPNGKMFTFKRNLTLYLAQTKLNKAIADHVCFASEILDLPPSYKMRKVKIIATPPDKDDSKGKNKIWTEDPDGTPKKRLIFSKSGRLLEDLEIGSFQEIHEPCHVSRKVRQLLEMHCYVHTIKFVCLAKYQYILTNSKVKFGDFHALMPALFGKAAHDPDAYLKKLKNEAKELDMESQAQWPRFWSSLQDYRAEMLEVELAGGNKKIKPLTDDEIFDIVLEKVRVTFPRINTIHLNTKGQEDELTTERIVNLLQIQESEVGLSGKRIRDDVKVNFTGGFSGHSYDQDPEFGGNKEGFSNEGGNSTPWKKQKYSRGDRRGKGKQGKGRNGKGKGGKGKGGKGKGGGKGGGGGSKWKKKRHCTICEELGANTSRIASHDADTCVEKGGGMEGEPVWKARRKTQDLDKRWHAGQAKANKAAASDDQDYGDEGDQGEVADEAFESQVKKIMASRLQGESGCGGLQVLLTGIEDTGDEHEMQVYRAGAFQAKEGHKQIDNGLSYFHLFSEQKWFPLGGTTNHKVSLKVAKESVKAVKAAMLGPVFAKVGPDTEGKYQYIGGDEHVGICDSRFAELLCYNRLERSTKNTKTGHRFVTAEDKLVFNYGKEGESEVEMQYSRDAHYLPIQPVTLAEVKAHFPNQYTKYGVELGRAKVNEIEAHPHEVAHMIEQADAHGVTTREEFMLSTHANPRQIDEMIRDGSIDGLEGAKKRAQARREDPLKMAPDDDCSSKRQGDMRPPQSKTHRHHESPFDYRKGEHLSMDPVGPVKVPAPRGLDSMMVYGDKSTGHISVQLYKSEAAGG